MPDPWPQVLAEASHTFVWDEGLHPRDRVGRFVDVLARLRKLPHGSAVRMPDGSYVTWKFGKYRLHEKSGRVTHKTPFKEKAAAVALPKLSPLRNYESLVEPPSLIPLAKRRAAGGF